jgi:hypothetical protein
VKVKAFYVLRAVIGANNKMVNKTK